MAWRIEYRWNGSWRPVSELSRPKSSSVLPFGVAVNAKNDMFSCRPGPPPPLPGPPRLRPSGRSPLLITLGRWHAEDAAQLFGCLTRL